MWYEVLKVILIDTKNMYYSDENIKCSSINTSFKKTFHTMSDTESESTINNTKSSKFVSNIKANFIKEDDISNNVSIQKQSILMKNYEESKNNVKPNDYITNLRLSELNEDSELFIIQCPKLLNPASLLKKKITINNDVCSYFLNEDIEVDVINKESKLCVLASKSDSDLKVGVKQLNFVAKLIMRESVTEHSKATLLTIDENIDFTSHISNAPFNQNNNIHFPVGLKSRHPLFGSDFKAHLKLETSVREKLRKAEESKQKRLKRKIKTFYKSIEKNN